MPFGYCLKQTAGKPPFKKLAVSPVVVTFNSVMYSITQGANDIHPFKVISSGDALDRFPTRRAGIFTL
jgi:hypothetical protein